MHARLLKGDQELPFMERQSAITAVTALPEPPVAHAELAGTLLTLPVVDGRAGAPAGRLPTELAPERTIRTKRGFYQRRGKRALDVVGCTAILIGAAPVLSGVWVSLRLALGPDVVLRQQRIGLDGDTFELYKFRTMESDRRSTESDEFAGRDRRQRHKTTEDPRHTPLGRIVRKFSLDELPQLVNVLKGSMSLVGPRPELASRADENFVAHRRHDVRPGLTGPYQVTDLRSAGDLRSGVELDGTYADSVSFRNDLRYLMKTVGALVRGTGN